MPPRPGQRTGLWISGGFTFNRKPRINTPQYLPAEETTRARNGKLFWDSLQPEEGWPTPLTKLLLPLSWGLMTGADIRTANDIIAIRGPFDIVFWQEISEAFWIDSGESLAGYVTRRSALDVVPAPSLPVNAATLYGISGRRGDGTSMTVTLGTPDEDGITPWTAPGTSAGEKVVVRITPAFRARVVEGQAAFPQPFVQAQTLTFEEC